MPLVFHEYFYRKREIIITQVWEILSENIEPNNKKIEHKRQIIKDLEDKYRRSSIYENRYTGGKNNNWEMET